MNKLEAVNKALESAGKINFEVSHWKENLYSVVIDGFDKITISVNEFGNALNKFYCIDLVSTCNFILRPFTSVIIDQNGIVRIF